MAKHPLAPRHENEDELYVVQIYWPMPVAPVWFTGVKLNSEGLFTRIVTNRHQGVEIAIMRYSD